MKHKMILFTKIKQKYNNKQNYIKILFTTNNNNNLTKEVITHD